MSKKILIVEDDVLIIEHLNRIVQNLNYEVVGLCSNYDETINVLKNTTPDLALLDIRMDGIDAGIEIAKHLNTINIPFVFITSFSDKDTLNEAIILQPKGYIVKPFTKEEIENLLNKIFLNQEEKYLRIQNNFSVEKIKFTDIILLSSNNVYVDIILKNKKITHRAKLSELESQLPSEQFWRVHQSHVVNKDYITKFENQILYAENNTIPVSRKYKADLKNKIESI